nr:InlB B-repeat-containing protein [Lachnospiraceae bacterium]
MKKKTLTKALAMFLSAAMAVTSMQMPAFADQADENTTIDAGSILNDTENGMEVETGEDTDETVDAEVGDYSEDDPDDGIFEDADEETEDDMDAESEDDSEEEESDVDDESLEESIESDAQETAEDDEIDYRFTNPEIDLFALDPASMSDEEISHTILSQDERDVKAWIVSMSEEAREQLLLRDTALSQTLDVYEEGEDGEYKQTHFDTYMDYLESIDEKAGYKFTSTTGNYYINWYNGSTSEGQSCISVSGMKKGDDDNTQQSDLTWKVVNKKHDLAIKAGGKKSWPNNLKSAQNKTNYQQVWADLTYVKPISYTSAVTYDSANSGSGDYRMFQGTHNSATGCLKENTGSGAGYYVVSGTNYTGSSAYTAATTETFNIGPNFTNLGCTDNATNSNTVARITLNPVYMSLTWNQNGGSGSNCQPASVLYGNAHTQATAPSRAGYTFAGWSGYSSAGVTGNKTYTAAWNPNQYTITYDGAGGSLSKGSDRVTYGGGIPAMPSA